MNLETNLETAKAYSLLFGLVIHPSSNEANPYRYVGNGSFIATAANTSVSKKEWANGWIVQIPGGNDYFDSPAKQLLAQGDAFKDWIGTVASQCAGL